ncbi:receptor-like protein 9DC3 [Gossypium hirsutum]|uniref:Receptor-like protein 9DC3 n=1 Tax=Gossypium hirsutum TaxID=3635 RepID=A0ABM3A1D9_GOSHI|nr:receptor-like protein 9DC3 [Gossypium hirsutum]
MAALESLDLSSNKLQGRIPVQLTDLTFLGALNLSHNNLEGQIPLANHFDTFSNDSFGGNPRLCGFPLSKKCGNNQEPESPPSTVADESETRLVWKIAAMGYGSGLVLGLSMGYIVFTTGRPHWYGVQRVDVACTEERMRPRESPGGYGARGLPLSLGFLVPFLFWAV